MENIKDLTNERSAKWSEIATTIDGNFTELNKKPGKVSSTNATGEIFNDYVNNKAPGSFAHAEGVQTTASGNYAHAEGGNTVASADYSHAEGYDATASAFCAHAEGTGTEASGICAHVEGNASKALKDHAHAEGYQCTADGAYSHAEGNGCTTSADHAHAEGYHTTASALYAHAEGLNTAASGRFSHSEGDTTTAENFGQFTIGRSNEEDDSPTPTVFRTDKPAFVIGNGISTSRGNAFKVLFNGQTFADGEYSSAGADYAECFEWKDANPSNDDRVGRFVTLEGDKIRLAKTTDTYILGVISAAPTIIGDNPMRWQGKYQNDEWGRPIYEDVEVEYTEHEYEIVEDENGVFQTVPKEVVKTRIDHVRKLNPNFNPEEKYIPRSERPEWDFVGMMGKLLVKQDGTLVAGSFCKSGADGVATKSESGYYVMKVINENQALVLFR